jgi:hypothetical protein
MTGKANIHKTTPPNTHPDHRPKPKNQRPTASPPEPNPKPELVQNQG